MKIFPKRKLYLRYLMGFILIHHFMNFVPLRGFIQNMQLFDNIFLSSHFRWFLIFKMLVAHIYKSFVQFFDKMLAQIFSIDFEYGQAWGTYACWVNHFLKQHSFLYTRFSDDVFSRLDSKGWKDLSLELGNETLIKSR